jgi:hypothetical protein
MKKNQKYLYLYLSLINQPPNAIPFNHAQLPPSFIVTEDFDRERMWSNMWGKL